MGCVGRWRQGATRCCKHRSATGGAYLDHGAHGAIDHHDALAQLRAQVRVQVRHACAWLDWLVALRRVFGCFDDCVCHCVRRRVHAPRACVLPSDVARRSGATNHAVPATPAATTIHPTGATRIAAASHQHGKPALEWVWRHRYCCACSILTTMLQVCARARPLHRPASPRTPAPAILVGAASGGGAANAGGGAAGQLQCTVNATVAVLQQPACNHATTSMMTACHHQQPASTALPDRYSHHPLHPVHCCDDHHYYRCLAPSLHRTTSVREDENEWREGVDGSPLPLSRHCTTPPTSSFSWPASQAGR